MATLVNTDKKQISAAAASIQTPGVDHTAGNCLAVWVGWGSGTVTVSSVTDDAGNTYAAVSGSLVQNATDGLSCQWWIATNIIGRLANKVTATFSASAGNAMIGVHQYSGVATSNATDGANTGAANGTAGTALSTGTIATTNANDTLIAGFELNGTAGTPQTPGSGFTGEINSGVDTSQITEDKGVTSTGTYSNGYTIHFSRKWVASMIAIKDAGAAAPVIVPWLVPDMPPTDGFISVGS